MKDWAYCFVQILFLKVFLFTYQMGKSKILKLLEEPRVSGRWLFFSLSLTGKIVSAVNNERILFTVNCGDLCLPSFRRKHKHFGDLRRDITNQVKQQIRLFWLFGR